MCEMGAHDTVRVLSECWRSKFCQYWEGPTTEGTEEYEQYGIPRAQANMYPQYRSTKYLEYRHYPKYGALKYWELRVLEVHSPRSRYYQKTASVPQVLELSGSEVSCCSSTSWDHLCLLRAEQWSWEQLPTRCADGRSIRHTAGILGKLRVFRYCSASTRSIYEQQQRTNIYR